MASFYKNTHASITLHEQYFNLNVLKEFSTVKYNAEDYDTDNLIDKEDVSKVNRMLKYTKRNSSNSITYKKKIRYWSFLSRFGYQEHIRLPTY